MLHSSPAAWRCLRSPENSPLAGGAWLRPGQERVRHGGRAAAAARFLAAFVPHLNWSEALLRIVPAAVFGGAIGVEREFREREAGLHTHLARLRRRGPLHAHVRVRVHDFLAQNGGGISRTDPTRISTQIVTGIGFLGAGAIIIQDASPFAA